MAYLRLEKLTKRLGSTEVVRALDFAVEQGQFVSILGPSGCGKTTTLRMIAGFLNPDQGSISIDGKRVDHLPSHKRGTAMVFQNYALFPHMTAFDNVAFGLKMQKVPKAEIAQRVQQALDLVRLSGAGPSYPKELSGGQQQRVALARALVLQPKILLLDEPLSNLDAKLRKDLRVELREIHRMAGITTVFVTHDIEEAFSLSDKVAVMNSGQLEQFGPPNTIFSRPATLFVADFVGHSNLVYGMVAEKSPNEKVLLVNDLVVRTSALGTIGQPATLAIPPHRIRVSASPLSTDNCFEGRVKHVSFMGATVHAVVTVGDLVLNSELYTDDGVERLEDGTVVFVGWGERDAICIDQPA